MSLVGMGLELKHIIETYVIRVRWCYITNCLHCKNHFKHLYISNKAEHFSYKRSGLIGLYINNFGLSIKTIIPHKETKE